MWSSLSCLAMCGTAVGVTYVVTRPGMKTEVALAFLIAAAAVYFCGTLISSGFAVYALVRGESPRWLSVTATAMSTSFVVAGVWLVFKFMTS